MCQRDAFTFQKSVDSHIAVSVSEVFSFRNFDTWADQTAAAAAAAVAVAHFTYRI